MVYEECGDESRLISLLSEADYCDTTGYDEDNLETFNWHLNYLSQFEYLNSITMYSIRRTHMNDIEAMYSLPSTYSLSMDNIQLGYIPEGLIMPELYSLQLEVCDVQPLRITRYKDNW